MLEIGKTLVSEQLFERKFLCDLEACKGSCCVEGDAGAPLEKEEAAFLDENFEKIKPFLRKEGIEAIEAGGKYSVDRDGEQVTMLVHGKECAYATFNENGIARCGIETAHEEGAIDFIKPISCHLYPIRISKVASYEALNYSEWDICDPACKLGQMKDLKVFRFLSKALVRRYGQAYYDLLEEVDKSMDNVRK